MTQEGGTPPGFWERIEQMIDRKVAALARSGMLRNASIGGGQGLTIGDGGALIVNGGLFAVRYREEDGGGVAVGIGDQYGGGTYVGTGLLVQAPDGTDMIVARQDVAFGNTRVDIYDSGGRIIFGNDAASEQGLARPYIPASFYPTRYADMTVSTTSATFETLFAATMYKQHPRLVVGLAATMDTAATTGEVKVLVNGVQLGSTVSAGFAIASSAFGPLAVAGSHMAQLYVEIQGRRTSASGALRVQPIYAHGLQT